MTEASVGPREASLRQGDAIDARTDGTLAVGPAADRPGNEALRLPGSIVRPRRARGGRMRAPVAAIRALVLPTDASLLPEAAPVATTEAFIARTKASVRPKSGSATAPLPLPMPAPLPSRPRRQALERARRSHGVTDPG